MEQHQDHYWVESINQLQMFPNSKLFLYYIFLVLQDLICSPHTISISSISISNINSVGLSELINAIHIENDITNGTSLYKLSPLGISLESLTYTPPPSSTSTTKQQSYLSSTNNPLYNIYMYALYRSTNGSGGSLPDSSRNTIHLPKSQMTFLNQPVSNYAHTIITDEYKKTSGYDSTLTSETIMVMSVWMSIVQSLYNAVSLCDSGIEPDINDSTFVNPIDVASALYIGNLQTIDEESIESSNSLYAWVTKASNNYEVSSSSSEVLPANVQNVINEGSIPISEQILNGLLELQTLLPTCWQSTEDDNENVAQQMRMKVDDIIKLLKIPLVQNLIYYSASVATGEVAPTARDTIDWVIVSLYLFSVMFVLLSPLLTPFYMSTNPHNKVVRIGNNTTNNNM